MMSRLSLIALGTMAFVGAMLLASLPVPARAGTYTILHAFGGSPGDGNLPNGLFVDARGRVFGTTISGGSVLGNNNFYEGTFYELVRSGRSYNEAFVHSFSCAADGCYPRGAPFQDTQGNVYVTTPTSTIGSGTTGTVVEFAPSGNGYRTKRVLAFDARTGNFANAGFLKLGGALYLTTMQGGAAGNGNVVQLSPDLQPAVLYAFKACCDDGRAPESSLVADSSGALYGTTVEGGFYGWGTVFKLTPSPSGVLETILYNFNLGGGGYEPSGSLVIDAAGNLYGMTQGGGALGLGTVFKLSPAAGRFHESVLHSFGSIWDGNYPTSSLLLVGDTLYGTTYGGGYTVCGQGCGTLFSIDTSGSSYSVLHRFVGQDGEFPNAALVARNGALYGTASQGPSRSGQTGYGLVFKYVP